jgi:CRP/FNR family transcriptional regulator, cyclic AMP receptor protein
MTAGEFAAWVASLLTFTTFYMKTMVPLRVVGILSNVAFLAFALIEHIVPVIILHGTLLPLNIFRLREILKLVSKVGKARTGDLSLEALLPFMTRRRFKAGEILFRKDDASHEMFYVRNGVIRLDEIGKSIGAGDMLGEISMFSPSRKRTATAVCETDGELLRMSDDQVLRLYHQNPRFGFLHRAIDHASTDRELRGVRFKADATRGGTARRRSSRGATLPVERQAAGARVVKAA